MFVLSFSTLRTAGVFKNLIGSAESGEQFGRGSYASWSPIEKSTYLERSQRQAAISTKMAPNTRGCQGRRQDECEYHFRFALFWFHLFISLASILTYTPSLPCAFFLLYVLLIHQ